MTVLKARNLCKAFKSRTVVKDVSLDIHSQEIVGLLGPNGAGKTTLFNLISRIYAATSGDVLFQGQSLLALAPHEIASVGIARTFQNIELFENASVLQNLLIGRHRHHTTSLWQELAFTPSARTAERETRRKVEEVIEFLRHLLRHLLPGAFPFRSGKDANTFIELLNHLVIFLDQCSNLIIPVPTDGLIFRTRNNLTHLVPDQRKRRCDAVGDKK